MTDKKNLAKEIAALRRQLRLAARAIRALLRDRGINPEGYITLAFKDADGYFRVDCDRGVIEIEVTR